MLLPSDGLYVWVLDYQLDNQNITSQEIDETREIKL
jgi:hypothetical protein